MHTRGRPKAMYAEADYSDVVAEVVAELRESIALRDRRRRRRERLIVDPGIGFAKRPAHSYGVLARLAELAAPRSAGARRAVAQVVPARGRSAIGRRPSATGATAAAVTAAVLAGAHIVRVHAVAEMVQVVRVAEEIRQASGGRS